MAAAGGVQRYYAHVALPEDLVSIRAAETTYRYMRTPSQAVTRGPAADSRLRRHTAVAHRLGELKAGGYTAPMLRETALPASPAAGTGDGGDASRRPHTQRTKARLESIPIA